ncbi:MAG: hypothetical protein R3E69_03625 [Steroidobacteraceae bacterium]
MTIVTWILGSIAGLVLAWFAVATLRHNLQIRRLAHAVAALPAAEYDALLARIDDFSPHVSTACLLIDTNRSGALIDTLNAASRIGGTPYVEDRDVDTVLSQGTRFLLQIRIPEQMRRSPWKGNLLVLFATRARVHCFRYDDPDDRKLSLRAQNLAQGEARPLRAVRVPRAPYGEKRHRNLFAPALLLREIPGLRDSVAALTSEPEAFLAMALAPTAWSTNFEMFERIQVGGSPQWVQTPETPHCRICARSMTFIAQVGCSASRALSSYNIGDVVYIFGCSQHLDEITCHLQFT